MLLNSDKKKHIGIFNNTPTVFNSSICCVDKHISENHNTIIFCSRFKKNIESANAVITIVNANLINTTKRLNQPLKTSL